VSFSISVERLIARPENFLEAVSALDTPAVRAVLRRYLSSSDNGFQAVGLAGLLERNDPDAIVQLAKIWPALGSVPQRSRVLFSLSDSFRDQSAALVRQLAGLVQTSSAELRTAAIAALAAIHSREALPVLASLLESADQRSV